jgi:hypothetical protein
MDIAMPPAFPETEFRAFGLAASVFFPALMSNENLFDPQEKKRHFVWAWQAVRYRYRICAECNDEFKALLANASESWRKGGGDEELTYGLERCIYMFFMSGLSVFDSFGFCLYFLGNAIQPAAFPDVANPLRITRKATSNALSAAFPNSTITELLAGLPQDSGFTAIHEVRNLLAHQISGRRSVRASSTLHPDGMHTNWREETWHLPGSNVQLSFDEELLQHHLNDITRLLTALAPAAREFAENPRPAPAQP